MKAWVDSIPSVDGGRIQVEKKDLSARSPGGVDMSKPRAAVSHTTETHHIDLTWSNGVPTMALGPHSGGKHPVLQQLLPFGAMGSALANPAGGKETNRWCILQVEQAGFSALAGWLPDKETQSVYASLMEFAALELGVPQKRPWPDVLDRPPMAVTTYYRRQSKWGVIPGWYKHAEVEGNHHWDSGSLLLEAMLKRKLPPAFIQAHQVMAIWKPDNLDHRKTEPLSPHFADKGDIRKWLVKDGLVRWKVWNHLRQGHRIRVATRRVSENEVRK